MHTPSLRENPVPAAPLLSLDLFRPAFRPSAIAGAVIGGAITLAPLHAQAQAGNAGQVKQLQQITVTGEGPDTGYQAPTRLESPKSTATLLDTPRTITVITEALMQDRGATSLQDVLRTTPGITLGSGEGGTPVGDRPFIRGYEASTDIFIDGARDYARGSHETFNLESVEITKGPSSSFTGRGGTGGSINLRTKSPKQALFAEIGAGFGNAGQWRTTADINVPFTDAIAARLNLMKMGGHVPGRDGVKVDRWGVAPSLAFGLGTPMRLTLSYSHVENDDMPDLGIPFSNAANPGRNTPPKVDRNNFYGRHNVDFRENTLKTATALFEYDFSDRLTLRNITRHVNTLNHYLMTRPTFDNCTARSGRPCSDESLMVEFRRDDRARWRSTSALINQTDLYGSFNTGRFKHTFSTGFEYSHENIYSRNVGGLPGRDHDYLYAPNPSRSYRYDLTYGDKIKDGSIRTQAFYVMDTIELHEQLSLNLGLRREEFKVATPTEGRKDSFWNYQLGLVYKPLPNGSIYVSYATSSNPAGENLGQGGGADGVGGAAQIRDVKPERSRSLELGTKWNVLNERLSLSAAVFETNKTDARSTDPLTGDVTLGGSNRVRGFELGVSGAITPNWNIWAGYTYLDPKIKVYRSGNSVYDGNRIKFIAKHSASLWTTYKVLPGLTVGGGVTYLGKRYANDDNTLVLPSHVRYDAMAKYEVNRQLTLQLNLNNLSNAVMYDASHVGIFANVGPGRSYMLNASYRWE